MRDRNFDDIAEKFSRNIYGTTKGQLRQTILWQDLDKLLAEFGDRPLRVLDAGFAIFLPRWLRAQGERQKRKV